MSYKVEKIAERISRHLEAAGASCELHVSSHGTSRYIFAAVQAEDGDILAEVKIRVSDHDLPPTYGRLNGWSDLECGQHGDACSDWLQVVVLALQRLGLEPAPITKAVIRRRQREAEREAARRAEQQAAEERAADEWREAARREWAALSDEQRAKLRALKAAADEVSGKARKRRLRKLKAALEKAGVTADWQTLVEIGAL